MALNCYQPHLLLLLEDDKNRQLYNGFARHPRLDARRIAPLPIAGGWKKVLEAFQREHLGLLRRYPERLLLLVIDFDDDEAASSVQPSARIAARRNLFADATPAEFAARVFVIGCSDEPEALIRESRKSKEEIGLMLALECESGTAGMWEHAMLRHNAGEVRRLRQQVRPFLFVP